MSPIPLLFLGLLPSSPSAQPCEAPILAPTPRIDAGELCSLLEAARATATDQLEVWQDGEPVLRWRSPGAPARVHVMSVTKSVAALAVGRLLQDGLLDSLDLPLAQVYPEWRQGRKATITVRHVLTHTAGLQDLQNAGVEVEPSPDVVQLALAAELETEPGTAFFYSNKAANLLAGLVHRLSGRPLDTYLRETIFADLGLGEVEWIHDPSGTPYAMAGLLIDAADLARLGQMMMDEGRWNGRPVIPEDFARASWRTQHELYPDHGLFWWVRHADDGSTRSVDANGWLGQYLVIVPEARVVAVRTIDRGSWRGAADGFGDFDDRVVAISRR